MSRVSPGGERSFAAAALTFQCRAFSTVRTESIDPQEGPEETFRACSSAHAAPPAVVGVQLLRQRGGATAGVGEELRGVEHLLAVSHGVDESARARVRA